MSIDQVVVYLVHCGGVCSGQTCGYLLCPGQKC